MAARVGSKKRPPATLTARRIHDSRPYAAVWHGRREPGGSKAFLASLAQSSI